MKIERGDACKKALTGPWHASTAENACDSHFVVIIAGMTNSGRGCWPRLHQLAGGLGVCFFSVEVEEEKLPFPPEHRFPGSDFSNGFVLGTEPFFSNDILDDTSVHETDGKGAPVAEPGPTQPPHPTRLPVDSPWL